MRFIYSVINLINGKVYVGQTKDFANRKAGHLYAARKGAQQPLYRAIRKYGRENFSFVIVEECDDDQVDDRERHWVSHFDSFNSCKGYNLTSGGESKKEFSKESREKIRQKALVRSPASEETRRKIGDATRGKPNLHFREMRAKQVGSNNPMHGRTGERHPRSKLTQAQADEIRQRQLGVFETVTDLAVEFGVSRLTVRRIRNNEIYKAQCCPSSIGRACAL